jgi:hypothetical protein
MIIFVSHSLANLAVTCVKISVTRAAPTPNIEIPPRGHASGVCRRTVDLCRNAVRLCPHLLWRLAASRTSAARKQAEDDTTVGSPMPSSA